MKNPPPAFASSTASQIERDFYAGRDDGRVHVLVTRPDGASIHVAVPITGPASAVDIREMAERFFNKKERA